LDLSYDQLESELKNKNQQTSSFDPSNFPLKSISPIPQILSNKSACHLKLCQFEACKRDCDITLELFLKQSDCGIEDFDKVISLKTKLFMRRCLCLVYYGEEELFEESKKSLINLHSSSTIPRSEFSSPEDDENNIDGNQEELLNDLQSLICDDLEAMIPFLRAYKHKWEGDSFFSCQDYEKAIISYSLALDLVPSFVGCLFNKAVSNSQLIISSNGPQHKEEEEAERQNVMIANGVFEDTKRALEILEKGEEGNSLDVENSSSSSSLESILEIIPKSTSPKRRIFVVKILKLQIEMCLLLRKFEEGIQSADLCLSILPSYKQYQIKYNTKNNEDDDEEEKQIRQMIQDIVQNSTTTNNSISISGSKGKDGMVQSILELKLQLIEKQK